MVEQGYISEVEKEIALAENPYQGIQEVNQKHSVKSVHSYFVDAVIEEVIADLQSEKGMTSTQANQLLFGGGVKIYTTFDPKIQNIVDQHVSDESLYPSKDYELKLAYSVTVKKGDGSTANLYGEGIVKNEEDIEEFKQAKREGWELTDADKIEAEYLFKIPQPQSAFVIMDHTNGHIKALSGGRGDKEGDRTFNRATQAKRQPGSVFKVLSAYAPALEMGVLAPGSILIDEPITMDLPSGPYSPRNWDFKHVGPVTVRRAIWHSINTVAVKTLEQIGIDTAYDYLLDFGFTTLSSADKGYALALGGLSEGVTPLELNGAMAAIANGGRYIEPILYTKVLDRDNNIILEKTPKTHPVISESTASMLIDMMEDVVKQGTGRSIASSFSGMPIAGKTGTTTDDKDFLFSGFTPYYTATIWLGHDEPKIVKATGREHLKIWGNIMNDIHQSLPYKEFNKVTTGYVKASICSLSGKAATELCKLDLNHTISTDYFHENTAVTQPCDMHIEKPVCTISGKIANEYCPDDVVETKVVSRTSTKEGSTEEICDMHTDGIAKEDSMIPENLDLEASREEDNGESLAPEVPSINPDDNNSFFVPQG